ncbi:replication stress response regulator SDE2 [Cyclospora cayetanensis]|uniref:Replication stress response regulator SDE2 n=1 Tax=Cyclospora cayetanensis TaxID=88456 RepID=A0A6P6RPW9_9EIME|nr:replication stress response regulator SDE2 [Cyclospora cayetanensis]
MASSAVIRPPAPDLTGDGCKRVGSRRDQHASDCVRLQPVEDSTSCSVTFLINLPWGGTVAYSMPLKELPLLAADEVPSLAMPPSGQGASPLSRLHASTKLEVSSAGLYLPGSFLISLAAARAGLPTASASQQRLVLQKREVCHTTFVPLETVIGTAAAAAVAASKGLALRAAAINSLERGCGAPLCSLWLLLRLPGGKGGFGALLKKQRRKKRANFSIDACRDLTGRRIRQAQVVDRIKAWMEKKRKEDALVAVLTQETQEVKVPEAKPTVSLDAAFLSQQIAQVAEMPDVVAHGLQRQSALRCVCVRVREMDAEKRIRAAVPQNRVLFAQLRDAVELDSEDDQWSDTDAEEKLFGGEQDIRGSGSFPISGGNTGTEDAGNSSSKKCSSQSPNSGASAVELMRQLEQMRLKASAAREAEGQQQAAAKAEAAKAAAEKVAREAEQLDVRRFNTVEELTKAVDAEVVKEKLRQLGWKCGGRPEERAARLLQLKTVDMANVPKALLSRQPVRMA